MTGQIAYRPLAEADLPLMADWLNRPHLRAFYQREPISPAAVAAKYGPADQAGGPHAELARAPGWGPFRIPPMLSRGGLARLASHDRRRPWRFDRPVWPLCSVPSPDSQDRRAASNDHSFGGGDLGFHLSVFVILSDDPGQRLQPADRRGHHERGRQPSSYSRQFSRETFHQSRACGGVEHCAQHASLDRPVSVSEVRLRKKFERGRAIVRVKAQQAAPQESRRGRHF